MRLLTLKEMQQISDDWLAVCELPIAKQNEFYERLLWVDCQVVFPLGELMNPNMAGYVWVWALKQCVHPEPITDKHRFNAQGLEGCFTINEPLSTAILMYREVSPDRINIFVPNGFKWKTEYQEFLIRWVHTGKCEATYRVVAKSEEEAEAYIAEHRLELEPEDVFPLSDEGETLA